MTRLARTKKKPTALMWGALGLGAALAATLVTFSDLAPSLAEPPAAKPASGSATEAFDPKADQLLHAMSDYLAAMNAFRFTALHTTEAVTDDGQKIHFTATSKVAVQRPDHLRSNRVGEVVNASLFYDGRALTIYGRNAELYATAPAPRTLDEMIDFARDRYGLDAPAADLLYSNPYRILMEDAHESRYLGTVEIDGEQCHHLAYRGSEVDWQLWIRAGDRPLPCKYVIVSKDVRGSPAFTVEFRTWETPPTLPADIFQARVSPKAGRIDFMAPDVTGPNRSQR